MIMPSTVIAVATAVCATFLVVNISYVSAMPGIPTLSYSLNYINQGYNGLKVTKEYRNRHTAERFFSGHLNDGRFNNPVYVTCGDESDKEAETILFYKDLMQKNRANLLAPILKRYIAIPYASFKVEKMTCYITSGECRDNLVDYQSRTLVSENGVQRFMLHMNVILAVRQQIINLGWSAQAASKDICVNVDAEGDHAFLYAFDPFKLTNGVI